MLGIYTYIQSTQNILQLPNYILCQFFLNLHYLCVYTHYILLLHCIRRRRSNLPAKLDDGASRAAVGIVSHQIYFSDFAGSLYLIRTYIMCTYIYFIHLVARAIKQTKSTLSNSSACAGKFICSAHFVRGRLSAQYYPADFFRLISERFPPRSPYYHTMRV